MFGWGLGIIPGGFGISLWEFGAFLGNLGDVLGNLRMGQDDLGSFYGVLGIVLRRFGIV